MGPFPDSRFERFVRLELLHVCGNEADHGMVRTTKRSSWNCMKGMWNGTVTMIKCLVISCRAFHMLFVLRGFLRFVWLKSPRASTMLSGLAFSVTVMLAARLLIVVLALAWGGM